MANKKKNPKPERRSAGDPDGLMRRQEEVGITESGFRPPGSKVEYPTEGEADEAKKEGSK